MQAGEQAGQDPAFQAIHAVNQAKTLTEACQVIIDQFGVYDPAVVRVASYLFDQSSGKLSPLANRSDQVSGGGYHISRDLIRDAMAKSSILWHKPPGIDDRMVFVWARAIGSEHTIIVHWEYDSSQLAPTNELQHYWLPLLFDLVIPKFQLLGMLLGIDDWVMHMVRTINAAIEAKDTYTSGHSERVSRYSMALAAEMGLDLAERKLLLISSLCHDIGKIGIPDAILKKPDLLSMDEFEEMKSHPEIGAGIIAHTPHADRIMDGVKYHHEKWDGTGYPHGLAGEEIPLFGRIVAIADAFDAMTSGRSYSGYMPQEQAISELLTKDDLFDPALLALFGDAFQHGRLTMRTGTVVGLNQAATDGTQVDSTQIQRRMS